MFIGVSVLDRFDRLFIYDKFLFIFQFQFIEQILFLLLQQIRIFCVRKSELLSKKKIQRTITHVKRKKKTKHNEVESVKSIKNMFSHN